MKKTLTVYLVIVVVAAVSSFGENASAGEWATIFNGSDIEGWEQKGGEATYKVEDRCIVGTTKPRTPNTFLCPPTSYGDFELTFEVSVIRPSTRAYRFVRFRALTKSQPDFLKKTPRRQERKLTENRFLGRRWKSLQTGMPLVSGLKVSEAGCWLRNLKSRIRPIRKTAGITI